MVNVNDQAPWASKTARLPQSHVLSESNRDRSFPALNFLKGVPETQTVHHLGIFQMKILSLTPDLLSKKFWRWHLSPSDLSLNLILPFEYFYCTLIHLACHFSPFLCFPFVLQLQRVRLIILITLFGLLCNVITVPHSSLLFFKFIFTSLSPVPFSLLRVGNLHCEFPFILEWIYFRLYARIVLYNPFGLLSSSLRTLHFCRCLCLSWFILIPNWYIILDFSASILF